MRNHVKCAECGTIGDAPDTPAIRKLEKRLIAEGKMKGHDDLVLLTVPPSLLGCGGNKAHSLMRGVKIKCPKEAP